MDLKVLRYFIAAVEAGSISGAANACHVAQPSITLAIAKLEDEFCCKLFDRHSKGSAPTASGVKLYDMAKDLISHAQSIQCAFKDAPIKESIRLKVDQNIRVNVLEKFILNLQERNNAVTLSLISPKVQTQQFFDMQLTTRKQIDNSDWFFPLMNEKYALLIPKNNPLAFKPNLELQDLNHQALVTRIHCENKPLFDKLCFEMGISFNSVAEVETEEWAHALVRSGLGLCFAPLPDQFNDTMFEVKYLDDLFQTPLPNRQIGLSVKPDKQTKIAALLPYLISE